MTVATRLTPDWRHRPSTQLLAVAIGVLPIYAFGIVTHLTKDGPYSLQELFLYPSIVGAGAIAVLLALLRFVCGETLAALNPRRGRWWSDLGAAIALTTGYFIVGFGLQAVVTSYVPRSEPPPDIVVLLDGLVANPFLLALWLGPVVWIGIAGFEELSRVFLLSRLWRVWPSRSARWVVILFSAALFGVAHVYQGPRGVISIGALALAKGWYFMRFGRFWPLVISHALFDSIQVWLAVRSIRGGP
jgi:membrane protease YdiL (CAAX protease family)